MPIQTYLGKQSMKSLAELTLFLTLLSCSKPTTSSTEKNISLEVKLNMQATVKVYKMNTIVYPQNWNYLDSKETDSTGIVRWDSLDVVNKGDKRDIRAVATNGSYTGECAKKATYENPNLEMMINLE